MMQTNDFIQLFDELEKHRQHVRSLKTDFQHFLSNKDVPLADRWSLYKIAPPELLEDDTSFTVLPTVATNHNMEVQDFFHSRYVELSGVELTENIISNLTFTIDASAELDAAIIELKEEVLSKAYGTLTFDW